MVKSVNFLSQTIFNYLGENSALLCGYTDIFPDEKVNDGVLWIQLDDDNDISSVAAVGSQGRTLLFTSEKTDFEELSFILSGTIASPDNLNFDVVDKKYLLCKNVDFAKSEKGISTEDFAKIKALETGALSSALEAVAPKIYRAMKNRCCGEKICENDELVSGGFISFCGDFSVITDVFTKEEYRGKGCGTALVKNLLKLSKGKKVYLVCEEKNLDFYKNTGFEIVKTVYEYER